MFRRRAPSNPAHKTPPSASASLAATKAFVRDRESNASLSSAAAAAALRTHATEPTQVGDTVTKRMARRQSLSSQGSGSQRPGPMRRHSSSGSMTERSFRAPSPRNSPVPSHDDAPPVPSVPKDVPAASVAHRRASSLEPPYRNASPVGRGGGRGLSLDRANPAPQRGQGHGARAASLSQVVEHDNDDNNSPRSINFSRPISPQQTAAPPIRTASQRGNSGWFSGPVVNPEATFRGTKTKPKIQQGATGYDLHNAQQSVQNAVDRPVKKNQVAHGVEGMRLSSGSMRAKPTGTAVQQRQPQPAPTAAPERPRPVDPKSPYAVYDPSSRTFIHKQDAMALHRQLSQEDAASSHDYVTQHMTRPHEYASPQQPKPARNVAQSPPSRAQYVEREPSPLRQEHPRSLSPSVEEEEPEEPEEVEMRPPTPPSVSHSPAGAILPRQSSEEFGRLDIKSLDEGRSPRKIDTAVASAVREATDSPVSPKQVPTQDGPYPRLGTPINLEPLRSGQGRGGVRTHSLSPPRNAHFAAVAVELQSGIRHQPPARSVSPAKSALKSSPSVSRRSSSPVNAGRVYGRAEPSEASDTMSEDGTKRRKKNVRVSFDEDAVIAGVSAYPEAEAPTPSTGLGASRWSTNNQQQDLDDVLKPRPVLPSFGSIRSRNKRQDSAGDVPEKVTETVSSSLSASVASMGEPLESSSDHALAGILAQDFAEKKPAKDSSNEPLPPEVTSVEGTGYNSESDSSDIFESASPESQRSDITKDRELPTPEPEPKSLTTPEHKPLAPEVPTIAVQPASPSPLVEKPEPMYLPPSLPGGWDEEESDREVKEKVEDKNITQPGPSPAPTKVETQPPGAQPQAKDEDSSDDDSSIYSDAYEELTDNEDDGFGSIDAVVESPSVGPSSGMMFSKHADKLVEPTQSALRNEYLEEAKQPSTSADLDATRQHWNDVHDARKQQKHEGSVEESPAVATPKRKPSKKSKERKAKSNTVTATAAAPAPRQPETPVQPRKSAMKKTSPSPQAPTTPQFRKSMRSGTDQERPPSSGQMKKTMRSTTPQAAPETHMRKSMRGSEPAGEARGPSGLAASRYSMPPPESKQPKGALQKKHIPATSAPKPRPQSMSAAAHASRPPAPPPAPKYDSDSDASASSFQRSRPRASRRQDSGRYTMRASMRSGPTPSMRPAPTMRPISPPEPSSPPATALRKSMRPSSPPTEPAAMRSSKFSIRSLSPAGRFRSTKSSISGPPASPSTPKKTSSKMPSFGKPKSKPEAEAPSKSRFKSRFADSSDEEEEEERPKRFQSRFADSDEEDNYQLPPGLAPVRGIPRKPGEEDGDSTDLEEELSDNEPPTPKAKEVEKNGRPTNGVTNGHSVNFAAESLQKSKHAPELPSFESGKKKSKRGFFGLGKKKKKKTSYIEDEPTPPAKASLDIPLPPEPHNKDRTLTPINEDKEVEAKQSAVTRSPKLQRRSLQHRSTSDSSWPLAEPPKIGEEERPQSSDGLPSRRISLRPTLSKRHSSQVSEAKTAPDSRPDKDAGVVGRAGTKKKKFQGLRRVFGLND